MEIFPDVGRIVCSAVISIDPIRTVPMAMAYRERGPGKLKTQLGPGSQWTDNTYRFEGDVAIWTHAGGKEWSWIAIPCNQLPNWFLEFQEKAQKRMDEREATASGTKETQQGGGQPTTRSESK